MVVVHKSEAKYYEVQAGLILFFSLLLVQEAFGLDFNGYIRGLAGTSSENDGATCFKLAGAGTKFRIGNECEIFGELMLGQELFQHEGGASLSARGMLSIYEPTSDEPTSTDLYDLGLPQAYLEAKNLPGLQGATVWAGRRYYKREIVHMTDFFYWNPSGRGVGIEDFSLGDVKLSYALMRNENSSLRHHKNAPEEDAFRHDFQIRGIKANPNGEMALGFSLIREYSHIANANNGWSIAIQHQQNGILDGGWNKLAAQYGVGPGIGLGGTGGLTNDDSTRRFRITENIYGNIAARWSGMATAVYQRDVTGGAHSSWVSMGGRIAYDVSEHFKVTFEIGRDTVKPENARERHLDKFTLAPTFSAAPGLWSRPELRLFYTYARWNDAARNAAAGSTDSAEASIAGTGVFGRENSASMVGFQLESWW